MICFFSGFSCNNLHIFLRAIGETFEKKLGQKSTFTGKINPLNFPMSQNILLAEPLPAAGAIQTADR